MGWLSPTADLQIQHKNSSQRTNDPAQFCFRLVFGRQNNAPRNAHTFVKHDEQGDAGAENIGSVSAPTAGLGATVLGQTTPGDRKPGHLKNERGCNRENRHEKTYKSFSMTISGHMYLSVPVGATCSTGSLSNSAKPKSAILSMCRASPGNNGSASDLNDIRMLSGLMSRCMTPAWSGKNSENTKDVWHGLHTICVHKSWRAGAKARNRTARRQQNTTTNENERRT